MFENIIGQQGTVETLRAELTRGSYPRSALFFGPSYSGKLSAALEAARVLTCQAGTGGMDLRLRLLSKPEGAVPSPHCTAGFALLGRGDRGVR